MISYYRLLYWIDSSELEPDISRAYGGLQLSIKHINQYCYSSLCY